MASNIKDRVLALEWDDVELLVAGLELETPRIIAEAKHRKGMTKAPQIRSFMWELRPTNRGLLVSTGGFTREARSLRHTTALARSRWIRAALRQDARKPAGARIEIPLLNVKGIFGTVPDPTHGGVKTIPLDDARITENSGVLSAACPSHARRKCYRQITNH